MAYLLAYKVHAFYVCAMARKSRVRIVWEHQTLIIPEHCAHFRRHFGVVPPKLHLVGDRPLRAGQSDKLFIRSAGAEGNAPEAT